MINVCRKQLVHRLPSAKSRAENIEIVEKLKTVEQEIYVLKSSNQQIRGGALQQSGIPTAWTFIKL